MAFLVTACPVGSNSNGQCALASYNVTPSTTGAVGIGLSTYGGRSVAQSFMLTSPGKPLGATVMLAKVGSFAANTQQLVATIEGNNISTGMSQPNGSPLAVSNPIDPSTILLSVSGNYTFTFSSTQSLTANQLYWLRIKASYGANTSNYILWEGFSGSNNPYLVDGVPLNAVYETGTPNSFSDAQTGSNRYLLFNIGC